ncbi:MAG TPA: Gfo/Idh/MocA family oxidoreductase [Acetobacteraceae bacterium]|jgi:phthalate 4,5-cis-dihydrodiol dehydrogenase|nr:Gfo/Idh/MocA family oxidoreductase [Acetobacteraceae bacterium]
MTGVIRLGVAGLGRAFMLMLPTFARDPRIRLVAAADPRPPARARFTQEFGGHAYESVAEMCADPAIDAVYVATPHEMHVEHVRLAVAHGRHVLVEKPMALTVADCAAMVAAADAAGVHLLVGHSHSFDLPYLRTRALIAGGAFGRVRMITALNYTDFLYRPRRPEELDTAQGGGAVANQAAHQVDVVRLFANAPARSVRAAAGVWDPARPIEGAYTAFLDFEGGVAASLTYSGYGRFDTDELCGWIGEMGQERDPAAYGEARRRLRGVKSGAEEAALRDRRGYGEANVSVPKPPAAHNHFGLIVVSCERADLRPLPTGVMIFGEEERRFDPLPAPAIPRAEVIDELAAAILDGTPPLHSGTWGLATVEICQAMLASAREGREMPLVHQKEKASCR